MNYTVGYYIRILRLITRNSLIVAHLFTWPFRLITRNSLIAAHLFTYGEAHQHYCTVFVLLVMTIALVALLGYG